MNHFQGVFVTYVGRMFVSRFAGLLLFFVIILQMLDLLNNSSEIYAGDASSWRSIVKYISLRSPQIASQFVPFAALLGIVLTLTTLNNRSEITIMRAAGMSVQSVLFPISFFCLLISASHFVFHEAVAVSTYGRLSYWEANDYAMDLEQEDASRADVRYVHKGDFISAASAARFGDEIKLSDITVYKRNDQGLTKDIIKVDQASFLDGTWSISAATSLTTGDLSQKPAGISDWPTDLDPEVLFAISLNPEEAPLPALSQQIGKLKNAGADIANELTSFLGRISKPLSTLVMPLLGAIAGYGVTRSGAQLARAIAGAGLGFGYFVIENLMLAIGKLGAAPAFLSAFFPFVLFMIVGFAILLAMEN